MDIHTFFADHDWDVAGSFHLEVRDAGLVSVDDVGLTYTGFAIRRTTPWL